jgi:hypothetical protein
MSMSRWNPIYSYLLNLIMTCLGTAISCGTLDDMETGTKLPY